MDFLRILIQQAKVNLLLYLEAVTDMLGTANLTNFSKFTVMKV